MGSGTNPLGLRKGGEERNEGEHHQQGTRSGDGERRPRRSQGGNCAAQDECEPGNERIGWCLVHGDHASLEFLRRSLLQSCGDAYPAHPVADARKGRKGAGRDERRRGCYPDQSYAAGERPREGQQVEPAWPNHEDETANGCAQAPGREEEAVARIARTQCLLDQNDLDRRNRGDEEDEGGVTEQQGPDLKAPFDVGKALAQVSKPPSRLRHAGGEAPSGQMSCPDTL